MRGPRNGPRTPPGRGHPVPGGEPAWLREALLRDPHRLDIHEFTDAVLGELAAVTRALDTAEGQARVGLDDPIDENRARLDLRGQALGAGAVGRPQRGAQAVGGVVGETD